MIDESNSFMDSEINNIESSIKKALEGELADTEKDIIRNEHKRNRDIVREILSTCKNFREEIKEEFNVMRGEEEDN